MPLLTSDLRMLDFSDVEAIGSLKMINKKGSYFL